MTSSAWWRQRAPLRRCRSSSRSPLIAAVILIEATGIGGPRLPTVLSPACWPRGSGRSSRLGWDRSPGSTRATSRSAPCLCPSLPGRTSSTSFGRFLRGRGRRRDVRDPAGRPGVARLIEPREFVLLPLAGLAVAGSAIAFEAATDHSVNDVLFSGEEALPGLVSGAGTWSVSALALVIVSRALAWTISLASFRGGPIFPRCSSAPRRASLDPTWRGSTDRGGGRGPGRRHRVRPRAAAVGGRARDPADRESGAGRTPLIIVGVVVAYLTTRALSRPDRAAAPSRPRVPMPEPPPKTRVDRWIDRR